MKRNLLKCKYQSIKIKGINIKKLNEIITKKGVKWKIEEIIEKVWIQNLLKIMQFIIVIPMI